MQHGGAPVLTCSPALARALGWPQAGQSFSNPLRTGGGDDGQRHHWCDPCQHRVRPESRSRRKSGAQHRQGSWRSGEFTLVNTGVSWPDVTEAWARVLALQTKMHHWARADPDRRFDDLFNLV